MQFFLLRYVRILFILSVITVILFQGYWIYSTYQSSKKEFLERAKLAAQKALIDKMMVDMSYSIKNNIISISNHENLESIIKKKLPNIDISIDSAANGSIAIDSLLNHISVQTIMEDKNSDSLLYHTLKASDQSFAGKDFVVYYDTATGKQTYPKGNQILHSDNTEGISTYGSDGIFRIHFKQLTSIILYKISTQIFFSLFYILIFLGTIYILRRAVIFNKQLLRNKEIFTSNMTHELKIPISTIMVAAESLEKYNIIDEPENARKYVLTIQNAVHQINKLVENILQHARSNNAKESYLTCRVNISVIMHDVRDTLAEIIKNRNAQILWEDPDETMYVKANYDQLKQVLINLLDNSLKYSEKEPVIRIWVSQSGPDTLIRIKDNGIGIARKYWEQIFEPYFKITEDDLHTVKGFGLGLSFVKKSLNNHGAAIRILKSGQNEGTTFELNIPVYES